MEKLINIFTRKLYLKNKKKEADTFFDLIKKIENVIVGSVLFPKLFINQKMNLFQFKEKLILASQSPQRKKILEDLGINFEIVPSQFEEIVPKNANPYLLVKEFALEKARDVAKDYPERWVLGVDTIVVTQEDEILIKPVDADDARRIVKKLSNSRQIVVSGIALIKDNQEFVYEDRTEVFFAEINDTELEAWIDSGLWKGRSGAFQIDGAGGFFVKKIKGDFYNVVGLPVYRFGKMIREISGK